MGLGDITALHLILKMAEEETLQDQLDNHDYENESVFIVDIYLYLLFAYVGAAALIGGLSVLVIFKASKKRELKMVKGMDLCMRIVSVLQVLNVFVIMPWASSLTFYYKMISEFAVGLFGFFAKEHALIRWASLLFQGCTMVMNVIFMVWIMEDIYCEENGTCEQELSMTEMFIFYGQYVAGFTLEALGMIFVANLMMSLGWFFNKRLPPKLNLEKYHLERPRKKTTIYDLFPHPVIYQL